MPRRSWAEPRKLAAFVPWEYTPAKGVASGRPETEFQSVFRSQVAASSITTTLTPRPVSSVRAPSTRVSMPGVPSDWPVLRRYHC
jgi:hypothetical protein